MLYFAPTAGCCMPIVNCADLQCMEAQLAFQLLLGPVHATRLSLQHDSELHGAEEQLDCAQASSDAAAPPVPEPRCLHAQGAVQNPCLLQDVMLISTGDANILMYAKKQCCA